MFHPLYYLRILVPPLICLTPPYHLNVTINRYKMIPLPLIKII